MARQTTSVEINTFVQGLITEASPLTFPENASLDEDNFVLLRDGSRRRRLGMDFEEGHQVVTTGIESLPDQELGLTTFNWENAGGDPNKELLVVQTGNEIKVFDFDVEPLSASEIYSVTLNGAEPSNIFSFTTVDGVLICATGEADIVSFQYDGESISQSNRRIKIRDFFGVSTTISGKNLREDNNVSFRPNSRTHPHIYNLRNQSWAIPRERGSSSSRNPRDPVEHFFDNAGVYPSNADTVNRALYPDPSDENNRTGDQFFWEDLQANPVGNMLAANGYFIIDALARGSSRVSAAQDLYEQYSTLRYPISNIPTDTTPGGAAVVTEFAGRVWYGGFSGRVIGGDDASPRMSSYVLFSRLVQDPADINKCYQEGDPTSKDAPDLLDTDGGFIRIDGAYRIQDLVNVGRSLMVIAQNGVWMVTGGSDFGFTANNMMVNKISEKGADSPRSVVVVDNTIIFWADDAIYHIKQNEFGDWVSENLTQSTIQRFYADIPPLDKFYAQGQYDSYENKVRWVYNNRLEGQGESKELILDVNLGAFYTSTVFSPNFLPRIAAPIRVPPFRLVETDEVVTYQGEVITHNDEVIVVNQQVRGQDIQETAYLAITGVNPLRYTFSLYRDAGFRDWRTSDGVGVDAEAFLVTGWAGGGDFLRHKQVPYVAFHLNRTEDGFIDDGTGNLEPVNQSSCIVQAQWDWTNSANSNRWGREFEAYRYRRLYSPEGAADPFDDGHAVITTRNKLRGKGRVISLYIRTSPDKDCQLLGWSMLMGVTGGV